MGTTAKRKIWLIIDHPWQLELALSISFGSPDNFVYSLIISKHKYWKSAGIEEYKKYFEEVFFFDDLARAHTVCQAAMFLIKGWSLRRKLKKLPVKKDDVFLTLSYLTYLENLLTSVFSRNRQVFLCRLDIYQVISKSLTELKKDRDVYFSKFSYIHYYILEPLLRLKKRTIFYWIKSREKPHDVVFDKPVDKLYDRILKIKTVFEPSFSKDEIFYPYRLLRKLSQPDGRKRIVFFLSDYVKNENYYQKISTILQFLRKAYGEKCLLEIRLHPNNFKELALIDSLGWIVNREPGIGDKYLIKHVNDIVSAFSHLSTILLLATHLKIPSYTYYRCFDFDENYEKIFDRIYKGMPAQFFLNSFEEQPQPYEIPINEQKLKITLNKLYAALTE